MPRRSTWIGVLLLGAIAQAGGMSVHKDERWGYRIRVPSDFKTAALSASEEWIASKHMSTRLLHAKKSEFYEADYPQIWVIGFPHKRQEERGARVGTKDGRVDVTFKNPYKDYKDFVKRERWFVGGGYYFSEEEEDEEGGVKVTKYEIKVEKMVSSPYRIVAWVYHFEDIDFAIQCKVLEDYYKQYKSEFRICLKSFKRIERKKALPGATTTGKKILKDVDEDKMSLAEKKKHRKEKFEATLQREIDALPDDWFVLKGDQYIVLSNGSKKFAREVQKHAEAIRGYLDKTFGNVGYDYVPPSIIRIFATSAELSAYYRSTSTAWFDWAEQVTLSEESSKGRKSWAMEPVSDGVTGVWLRSKNKLLADNMPWWFRYGLERHMRFARVKGRRVTIKPDEYDREYIKRVIDEGKAIDLLTLFQRGDEEQTYGYQAGSVVSWLLTDGNRGKTKGCIQKYLMSLIESIEKAQHEYEEAMERLKQEAEEAAMAAGETESEDESGKGDEGEEIYKAFLEAMKKKKKAIREEAFQKTFGHLSQKDWDRLYRKWLNYAG